MKVSLLKYLFTRYHEPNHRSSDNDERHVTALIVQIEVGREGVASGRGCISRIRDREDGSGHLELACLQQQSK